MDIPKKSLITDGPEYSRLSESVSNSSWYAEGHTDPTEDEERRREQADNTDPEGRRVDGIPPPLGNDLYGAASVVQVDDENGEEDPEDPDSDADDEGSPVMRVPRGGGACNIPDDGASTSMMERPASPKPDDTQDSPACGGGYRILRNVCDCLTTPLCFIISFLSFSFILCIFLGVTFWLVPEIKKVVIETATLQENTSSLFVHPEAEITMKIYINNVTSNFNPVTRMTHLKGEAKGPYTYTVQSWKTDVVWNDNSTVSYRVNESYHFMPEQSLGREGDIFNTVDIKANLAMLSERLIFNPSFSVRKNLLKPRTVKDFLWGDKDEEKEVGMEDEFLDEVDKVHKNVQNVQKDLQKISDNKVKESEVFNVYTGMSEIGRLNQVYSYGYRRLQRERPVGQRPLPSPGVADGDFFSPFVNDEYLVMFYRQLKRNVLLKYLKSVTFKGETVNRYVIPNDEIQPDWTSGTTPASVSPGKNNDSSSPRESFFVNSMTIDHPDQGAMGNLFLLTSHCDSDGPSFAGGANCNQHLDVHPMSGRTMRKRLCYQTDMVFLAHDPLTLGQHKTSSLPLVKVDLFFVSPPNDLTRDARVSTILGTLSITKQVVMALGIILLVLLLPKIIISGVRFLGRRCCGQKKSASPPASPAKTE